MFEDLSVQLKKLITSAVVDALREVERTNSARTDKENKPRIDDSVALLTTGQVAEALGVSQRHIRRMTVADELPSIRLGSVVRYRASSLREWMAARELGTDSIDVLSSKSPSPSLQAETARERPKQRPQRTKPRRQPSPTRERRSPEPALPAPVTRTVDTFKRFVIGLGVPYEPVAKIGFWKAMRERTVNHTLTPPVE